MTQNPRPPPGTTAGVSGRIQVTARATAPEGGVSPQQQRGVSPSSLDSSPPAVTTDSACRRQDEPAAGAPRDTHSDDVTPAAGERGWWGGWRFTGAGPGGALTGRGRGREW